MGGLMDSKKGDRKLLLQRVGIPSSGFAQSNFISISTFMWNLVAVAALWHV